MPWLRSGIATILSIAASAGLCAGFAQSTQAQLSRRPAEHPASISSAPALLLPIALAYDKAGNLFFADARRHQVFELTLAGTWAVIAGTGEQGFAGDGGPATAALLNRPRGLAVAADGTLYIADSGNQRVRAVAHGTITTIAGTGERGMSGDGTALQATLRDPTAMTLDGSGNLLLCDTGNHRVKRIAGATITTVAGNGVQGFSGDGGAGTAAELDTPLGVAVSADGTVLIADTHNHRIRSLTTDGTIGTFAGTSVRGFAGDGGPATAASLNLPYGVATRSDGSVLIADAGNQVLRSVSSQGIISTLAGEGVQGNSTEATARLTAALNSPRAVSVQRQGQPVLTDSRNGVVRELANDDALYTLALLASTRISTVALSTGSKAVYGQGMAAVTVSGSAATPQGTVALLDNGSSLGSSPGSSPGSPLGSLQLEAGRGSFSLAELAVGTHVLTASYAGDGLNGSATSADAVLSVIAAPATAMATAATAVYGAPLPSLSGTLTGILPRDRGTVSAVFRSQASPLSPVGAYPITAALEGQGSTNYVLSLGAGSGSLTISPAATLTTLSPLTAAYAGLPVLLSARVASATSGSPSGPVEFLEDARVIGAAQLVNGVASTSLLAASAGAHTYGARYSGDTNFLSSASTSTSLTVAATPDFALSVAFPAQSVQGGSTAVFTVNVSPQNGPFTGVVALSVTGLPPGAKASFSPVSVIPGASTASVSLSIQTVARTGALEDRLPVQMALAFGFAAGIWWLPRRRGGDPRRSYRRLLLLMLLLPVVAGVGCGTRTTGSSVSGSAAQTYSLTAQGTGTNLAGAVVSHSSTATLTVY